jgi:outer membrane protein TolC
MFMTPVFGQQKNFTLSELVDSAKVYLPQVSLKYALLGFSKAAVVDTRHSFLPSLKVNEQVNLGTDNSVAGSYTSFGIVPSASSGVRAENIGDAATGNIAILYGQYDLIDFGYRHASMNSAQAYVDLQKADLEKEIYNIQLQISRIYFFLLKEQTKLKSDAENVKRYESIFDIINALAKSGIRPGSDSSLAKAELSKTRITYNQTMGDIIQLKTQLSYFTGIALGQMNVDSSALQSIKLRSGAFNTINDSSINPVIDYYQKLKNVSLINEKLISRSFLPKIVLTATSWARGSSIMYDDKYTSLDNGLGFQRFNYLAGLSFQYDLFNGIHKKDKLNLNHFQTAATDYGLQQQRFLLNAASLQADNAIQTTEKNLFELPVQLTAAQDTYNQKMAQYKAGVVNLVDLTNAAFVLYRSMNDYAETLGDWYLAQLDKAASTGKLDTFIQLIK